MGRIEATEQEVRKLSRRELTDFRDLSAGNR